MKTQIRAHRLARALLLIALAMGALELSGVLSEAASPALKVAMTAFAMASVAAFLVALIRFHR